MILLIDNYISYINIYTLNYYDIIIQLDEGI
jgi:hypothetical protein